MIGQDHVTTPLRRALRNGRVGHAYLFSGPRGCGKTTSARILARCLNCAQGPTDTPCGTCDSCQDLARDGAGSLDVVEIDAASHGGVDDARELRERASFAPVRDRFKVFIIDEAHMVTSAGFNALLKLVEEPPEHVKFVFATTEPDKVIGTIRSRTHHYPFRLIPPQVLGPYLRQVCDAEGVQVGDGVLPLVVRAGGGSARDSMSVLDQLMAGAGEDGLDQPTAIALLGFTDTALLDRAVTAIAERDGASLYAAVEQVLTTGHEPRRFVEDLLERIRDLIVLAAVPENAADLLPQVPADDLEAMRAQSGLFAPADLSLCGDLTHETLSTMSGATSPRLHLELLAARLVLRDERAGLGAPASTAPSAGSAAPGAPGPAPAGRAPAGGAAPAGGVGGSGREEARRIAQERAQAARNQRGGNAPTPGSTQQPPAQQPPAAPSMPPATPQNQPGPTESEQAPPAQSQPPQSQSAQNQSAHDRLGQAEPEQAPPAQDTSRQGSPAQGASEQAPPQQPASAPQQPTSPAGDQQDADAAGGADADAVRAHWSAILDELAQIRRPSWALIAQNGHVHDLRGSTLIIGFRTDGLLAAFRRGTGAENLAEAVRRIMRLDVSIDAVVGEDPGPGGPGGQGGPGGPGGPRSQVGPDSSGAQSGPGAPSASGGTSGPRSPQAFRGDGEGERQDRGDAAGTLRPISSAASRAGRPSLQTPASDPSQPEDGPDPSGGPDVANGPASARGTTSANGADPTSSADPAGDAGAREEHPSRGTAAARAAERWGDASATSHAPAHPTPDPGPAGAGPALHAVPPLGSPDSREPAPDRRAWGSPSPNDHAPAPEDFPPEPDDDYDIPPEPEVDVVPARRGDHAPTRREDTAPIRREDATPERREDAPPGPDASAEIPVVEDAGRDSLPDGQPRTYGQNALKQALAEGRVVHSRPATRAAAATSPTPGGPVAAPDPGTAPPSDTASQTDTASQAGAASEREAAVQQDTAAQTSTVPSAGDPAAPPRRGAALAREAAQATRAAAASRAAERRGGRWNGDRDDAAAGEQIPEDPTGGASRDDEDAQVVTRSGREVVESLLGGRVLEVIDETQHR